MAGLVAAVSVSGRSYASVFQVFFRPRIWVPFFVTLLVQLGLLALIVSFHRPAVLPIAAPLVKALGGDLATRYPAFYLALPTMMVRGGLVITVLVESIAIGAATLYFARVFGLVSGDAAQPWRRAVRRAPGLILVAAVSALVVLALDWLIGRFAPDPIAASRAARWGVRGGGVVLFLLVQCAFAYATPWMLIAGHRALPAVRDSFRVAARTFLPTMLVLTLALILLLPFWYAGLRVDFLVSRFRPEVVTGLLVAQFVTQMLATFLAVGAITRLFMWRIEVAR